MKIVPMPPAPFPTMRALLLPGVMHQIGEAETRLQRPFRWLVDIVQQPETGDILLGAIHDTENRRRTFLLATYDELVTGAWKTLFLGRVRAAVRSLITAPFYQQRLGAALRMRARMTSSRLGCSRDAAEARHHRLYAHLYEG